MTNVSNVMTQANVSESPLRHYSCLINTSSRATKRDTDGRDHSIHICPFLVSGKCKFHSIAIFFSSLLLSCLLFSRLRSLINTLVISQAPGRHCCYEPGIVFLSFLLLLNLIADLAAALALKNPSISLSSSPSGCKGKAAAVEKRTKEVSCVAFQFNDALTAELSGIVS